MHTIFLIGDTTLAPYTGPLEAEGFDVNHLLPAAAPPTATPAAVITVSAPRSAHADGRARPPAPQSGATTATPATRPSTSTAGTSPPTPTHTKPPTSSTPDNLVNAFAHSHYGPNPFINPP